MVHASHDMHSCITRKVLLRRGQEREAEVVYLHCRGEKPHDGSVDGGRDLLLMGMGSQEPFFLWVREKSHLHCD